MENHLFDLPIEIIIEIAIKLPLKDIHNLCQTHPCLNRIIGRDSYFWKLLYIRDIAGVSRHIEVDWKKLYQTSGDLWTCGNNALGQLGLEIFTYSKPVKFTPTRIKIKAVAC